MIDRPAGRGYVVDMNDANKTVLITGCSSGYGLETARHFHAQGWNVIATMRTPRADLLPRSERMRVLALDVTSPDSITAAIAASGPIDVLVNNAGIGLVGVFEATPMATIRELFETNTFGVMAMTQAVLPQMRARRSGVVVNVTSSVTLTPMPLAAVYTASKAAIEGFTGSLAHELAAFDVRVKLVEPGYCPTTRFASNGGSRMDGLLPDTYAAFARPVFEAFSRVTTVTSETDVAEVVYRAASDASGRLRFPAGPDAVALAGLMSQPSTRPTPPSPSAAPTRAWSSSGRTPAPSAPWATRSNPRSSPRRPASAASPATSARSTTPPTRSRSPRRSAIR